MRIAPTKSITDVRSSGLRIIKTAKKCAVLPNLFNHNGEKAIRYLLYLSRNICLSDEKQLKTKRGEKILVRSIEVLEKLKWLSW